MTAGADPHGPHARVGSLVETDLPTLLSGEHAAELRELLEERSVVAIRGIEVDDEQQVAIARTLGEVESSVVGEIYKVTFDKKDNPVGASINRATFFWHIDRTDLDVPPFASMLSAKVLTPTGGQTEFVNTYAAYDDLPDDEKERLDDVRVVHCMETAFLEAFPDPTEKQLAAWKHMPVKTHPLVWHHRSGRNSLVLSNSATAVVGMDDDEGQELLEPVAGVGDPTAVRLRARVGDQRPRHLEQHRRHAPRPGVRPGLRPPAPSHDAARRRAVRHPRGTR